MRWSVSAAAMSDAAPVSPPAFPTETEIYILPDGRVVVADLPAELVALIAALGQGERSAVTIPPQEEHSPEPDQSAVPNHRVVQRR